MVALVRGTLPKFGLALPRAFSRCPNYLLIGIFVMSIFSVTPISYSESIENNSLENILEPSAQTTRHYSLQVFESVSMTNDGQTDSSVSKDNFVTSTIQIKLSENLGIDITNAEFNHYLFGINHEKMTYKYQGRRFRLTDVHGDIKHDLLA